MKLLPFLGLACILQFNIPYMRHFNKLWPSLHNSAVCHDALLQTDSVIPTDLRKLYKHGMPILLSDVESILGKTYQVTEDAQPPKFTHYTWETKSGLAYEFEDINYNEKCIELDRLTITSKQVAKHPLGIYLNQTTLAACKKTFPGFKKSLDERTYKFKKNKVWYFLEFNKQNVLIKIKSVEWDTDLSG